MKIDDARREGLLAPDNDDHFCRKCSHPHGYHAKDRGCTMPLNAHGVPVGPQERAVDNCRCGETDEYKTDRLRRVMEAKHAGYLAASRAYTDHIAAMLDKAAPRERREG